MCARACVCTRGCSCLCACEFACECCVCVCVCVCTRAREQTCLCSYRQEYEAACVLGFMCINCAYVKGIQFFSTCKRQWKIDTILITVSVKFVYLHNVWLVVDRGFIIN